MCAVRRSWNILNSIMIVNLSADEKMYLIIYVKRLILETSASDHKSRLTYASEFDIIMLSDFGL